MKGSARQDDGRIAAQTGFSGHTGSAVRNDPDAWERGCATDPVRNNLVIPDLAWRLSDAAPRTVLDVGSGTGYITRQLAGQRWARQTRWTLVDVDDELLEIAARSMAPQWEISTNACDLTSEQVADLVVGEFAFLAFTLLELRVTSQVARNLAQMVRPGGRLVIYLPDVLSDVLASRSATAINGYKRGLARLVKTDHFTGGQELFYAHRPELLLDTLLQAGFVLRRYESLPRSDRRENIYCLDLERNVDIPSG